MFLTIMLIPTLLIITGYAGSSSNDAAGGQSYGFSGSFAGSGAPPDFFQNMFNGYFDSFKKYQDWILKNKIPYAYSITSNSPSAYAQAQSSITFDNPRIQQEANLVVPIQDFPAFDASNFVGDINKLNTRIKETGNGAVASASLGPQGGYQMAAVYPENPNSPNIFTRFGGAAQGGSGKGVGGTPQYGSVFTSSVSSSSNIDGKAKNFHRATTTINDNGKVSTYTVTNP